MIEEDIEDIIHWEGSDTLTGREKTSRDITLVTCTKCMRDYMRITGNELPTYSPTSK